MKLILYYAHGIHLKVLMVWWSDLAERVRRLLDLDILARGPISKSG